MSAPLIFQIESCPPTVQLETRWARGLPYCNFTARSGRSLPGLVLPLPSLHVIPRSTLLAPVKRTWLYSASGPPRTSASSQPPIHPGMQPDLHRNLIPGNMDDSCARNHLMMTGRQSGWLNLMECNGQWPDKAVILPGAPTRTRGLEPAPPLQVLVITTRARRTLGCGVPCCSRHCRTSRAGGSGNEVRRQGVC